MDSANAYAPTATITFIIRPPPPFPAPPRSVDLSALEFILGLIGVISIPALIYTFFFAIKCSPRRHSSGGEGSRRSSSSSSASAASSSDRAEVTSDVKYNKETHGAECPVCLSAFAEGGEVKVLSACNHAFHTSCIDKWLNSQSNCPVCRAPVAGKRPNTTNNSRSYAATATDMHQGLPDASHLV